MPLLSMLTEIWRGKDSYRVFMNNKCQEYRIEGKVLDIGSGLKLASYHRFLKKAPGTDIHFLDLTFALGFDDEKFSIDLEKDSLPENDNSIDGVLMFNVLEHLHNYIQVINESKRVLKPGAQLLGVVPFLVNYHPDPHDYWRYTSETLFKIFSVLEFSQIKIEPFGAGPFLAGWSHIEQVIPKILKIVIFPLVLLFDAVLQKVRPGMNKTKFPLGYFFSMRK